MSQLDLDTLPQHAPDRPRRGTPVARIAVAAACTVAAVAGALVLTRGPAEAARAGGPGGADRVALAAAPASPTIPAAPAAPASPAGQQSSAGQQGSAAPVRAGTPAASGVAARLTRLPATGARSVRFRVAVTGRALQPVDAVTGKPITNPVQLLEVDTIDFGDGTTNGTDPGGDAQCARRAPSRPVRFSTEYAHTYRRPGRYTVTYTTASCQPGSRDAVLVRTTAVVRVPAPVTGARLTLTRLSPAGSRDVTVAATVRGRVPLAVDAVTGELLPRTDVQGVRVDFGDGFVDGADPGTAVCRPGTPLREIDQRNVLQHRYARPGTYTIRYATATCAPGLPEGDSRPLVRTLVVTVR